MLVAKYNSTCAECHLAIIPGDSITLVGQDDAVHMLCPDSERGTRGVGRSAEPVGSAAQVKNNHMGRCAVDPAGNVLAIMTPHGWQELSDANPEAPRAYLDVDVDRHLRIGKGTQELLETMPERLAFMRSLGWRNLEDAERAQVAVNSADDPMF